MNAKIGGLSTALAAILWLAGSFAVPGSVAAEALLLVEADSGKVLHSQNATSPWYPASVTKLMTAYLTLQAVKEGRLRLDSLVAVSKAAAEQAPSKMGFPIGTQVTVDNALKMMMVKSANDIAVVLAEGVAGSVDGFAAEMNTAARRLGMTQSHFVNPNGLPDDAQVTSARDMAILARALLKEFPEHELYWRIPAIRFGKRLMRNTNRLIEAYPGTTGMKTGFICASGFNLVASATRGDKRLIAVVLGAPSSQVRAVKTAQLFERGFAPNPLAWLTPALGTVENLAPVDAAPPDLRDDMCGKHRKRPAAEGLEEELANADPNSPFAVLLMSLRAPTPKGADLIRPVLATMPPVVVYTGPARPAGAAILANAPVRAKLPRRQAAKPKSASADVASAQSKTAKPAAKPAPRQGAISPIASKKPTSGAAVKPKPTSGAAAKPKPASGAEAAPKPQTTLPATARAAR